MSDTPDRLGLLNGGIGGTAFGRPFCEYPAPHSDLAGVRDQESSPASSASSEDFSDLFDWNALYARGALTDVTAHSDAPSEGKPAAAAPVSPAASHGEDHPMLDAPSPQVPHVWPEVLGPHPPRHSNIRFEQSPSPPPSADMHLQGHSHPTPPQTPPPKRTRVVKCPDETSHVREMGSCYNCKMSKTGCDAEEVCIPCSKRPLSDLICIRKPLHRMLPPTLVRWSWNDPSVLMPSRDQFIESDDIPLFISLSDSPDSPLLPLRARAFTLPNQRSHGAQDGYGIAPDGRPSQAAMREWMTKQLLTESKAGFEAELDRLLVRLVSQTTSEKKPEAPLLSNLLEMRCMSKLWSCKQLYFRQQPGSKALPFNIRFASIRDSLCLFAAQAISELERRILPEVDNFRAKKDTPVAKWLVLWQLMLIYRQSLSWVLEQQQTDAAPLSIEVMPLSEERHRFRETSRQLLEGITVTYAALFTSKGTTMAKLRNAGPDVFGDDCTLQVTYESVWQALPDFYQQVLRQVSPTDMLFIEYVVKKESKNLAGKPRTARR